MSACYFRNEVFPVRVNLESEVEEVARQPERQNRRIHVALPVRITQWDSENRPSVTSVCTYDISALGARVTGLRGVKLGEIIAVERGRMGKIFCRVVWIGERNTPLQGQIGIQNVELQRTMWETELQEMEEVFEPLPINRKHLFSGLSGDQIRRCGPRFEIQGSADLQQIKAVHAGIKNLSEMGCLLESNQPLPAGANVKLTLQVAQYDFTVKGAIRHVSVEKGMGVEFSEIRKGDRQVLQFLMKKLTEQQFEQAFQLEA